MAFLVFHVANDYLLTDGIAIGPAALGKGFADHHLVWGAEHLLPVTRQQAVVEELEEVGGDDK